MNYLWDLPIESTREVVEEEPQTWLVRYPKDNGGHFTLKFRIKKNPIGFVWSIDRRDKTYNCRDTKGELNDICSIQG